MPSVHSHLVLPLALRTNESLASIFYRSAKHNYGDEHAILRLVCNDILREHNLSDNLSQPTHPITFEILASLLCIDEQQLYESTAHRFTEVVTPMKENIGYEKLSIGTMPITDCSTARRHLRPLYRSQYCPECLRESQYHQIVWIPYPVTVCLKHLCLLIDNCLSCGHDISLHSIVDDSCTHCGCRLSELAATNVSESHLGVLCQQTLYSWLLDIPSSDFEKLNPVKELSSRALYSVMDGLQTFLNRSREGESIFSILPNESTNQESRDTNSTFHTFTRYSIAFTALIDWPKGFHGFLDSYRRKGELLDQKQSGATFELGVLYSHWIEEYWKDSVFQPVQEAFDAFYATRYGYLPTAKKSAPSKRNLARGYESPYITITAAAAQLETSPETVERLIELRSHLNIKEQDA